MKRKSTTPMRRMAKKAKITHKKAKRTKISTGNVVNALAGKAAMSVRGKKNIKPKGVKRVKVSALLRKKITETLTQHGAKGTYRRLTTFPIGPLVGLGNTPVIATGVIGGYSAQQGYETLSNLSHPNSATFIQVQLTPLKSLQQGADMIFFSPAKVLDAASILFNNKAPTIDYTIATGNFATETTASTGQPVQTNTLKLNVIDSYTEWTMKNTSARTLIVEIYHCRSKLKFAGATPLADLVTASYAATNDLNGEWNQNQSGGNYAQLIGIQLAQTVGVDPNAFNGFAANWKYEKMTIQIAPGETCFHKIQGPKNCVYDYSKYLQAGTNNYQNITKETVAVMMKVYTDLVTASKESGTVPSVTQDEDLVGRFDVGTKGSTTVVMANPIAVQLNEVYRIQGPDVAGFVVPNAGIGTGAKSLNMRKNTKAITVWPFNVIDRSTATAGAPAYIDRNEEQPATAIGDDGF